MKKSQVYHNLVDIRTMDLLLSLFILYSIARAQGVCCVLDPAEIDPNSRAPWCNSQMSTCQELCSQYVMSACDSVRDDGIRLPLKVSDETLGNTLLL